MTHTTPYSLIFCASRLKMITLQYNTPRSDARSVDKLAADIADPNVSSGGVKINWYV